MELFQVLLCITNKPIKHESFVYTELNDQTDLFQTIQFVAQPHTYTNICGT